MINHIVSFGETLSDIAVKYDMSINEILKINPQLKNPDTLHSGQDINVHPKEYEAPIDMGLYCLSCNPDVHWLELRFKSENNEGIAGLNVTIMDANNISTTQPTDSTGMVRFDKVALGAVSVWVEQKHLLSTVEQYASRDKTELPDSAIKAEAEANQHHYRYASVADLWDTPPEDKFLIKHHPQQFKSRGRKGYGMQVPVNQTIVFEIKAVRSLVPYLLDTDNYNLVTAYNMALMTVLSYADYIEEFDARFDVTTDLEKLILEGNEKKGYINDVLASWRAGRSHTVIDKVAFSDNDSFILKEVPYSLHLKGRPFVSAEKPWLAVNESSEAFVLYNQETVIVSVRGTQEPQDVYTDLKASGIAIDLNGDELEWDWSQPLTWNEETRPLAKYYAHTGFYRYTALIKDQIDLFIRDKIFSDGQLRNVFITGHSLGGASAFLYSAFFSHNPSLMSGVKNLRLFTYGEPRSLTFTAVVDMPDLLHYRHVNFADPVPRVPPNTALGFNHHGQLIQLFDYHKTGQVMVFPEQSGIDTLGAINKSQVENDTYQGGMGMSLSDHSSLQYTGHLMAHLRYYLQTDTNQQHRYQQIVGRLEAQNRLISQDSRDSAELDYQYDTNREAIEWLEKANASSRLTSALVVFGDVDEPELTQCVTNQILPNKTE